MSDAQIQKYVEGLTEEQLDKKIQEIGELMDKEDPNPNIQDVIVEGHIFKIDKSVPKIIDYVGPADGIIITAVLSNNATDGWLSADESDVNIKGKIITYSGGKVTEVSAKSGETLIEISVDKDGNYIINHITESATITIHTKDSKGKENKKEIEVKVRIDKTVPTVETVKAEVEGNKIKLSATGHDKAQSGEEQSGIKEFHYTIISADGVNKASGTFSKNEVAEITITNWVLYTIKVTATDKCQNTTTMENAKEQTVDMRDITPPEIKLAEAKAYGLTIRIKAIAEDSKSGLASLRYSITPTTGIPSGKNEGELTSGSILEITSTTEATYTVTFTATDNATNETTKTFPEIKTIDGGVLKHIRTSKGLEEVNTKEIYGATVTGYNCTRTGVEWQIFYIDETKDNTGNVTDSQVYLISKDFMAPPTIGTELTQGTGGYTRSYSWNDTVLNKYKTTIPNTKFTQKFLKEYVGQSAAQQGNLQATNYMLDQNVWLEYKDTNKTEFTFGGPTLPLFQASYNDICKSSTKLGINKNVNGYQVNISGGEFKNVGGGYGESSLQSGIYFSVSSSTGISQGMFFLASPNEYNMYTMLCSQNNGCLNHPSVYDTICGFRPVVCLNSSVQFTANSDGTYKIN